MVMAPLDPEAVIAPPILIAPLDPVHVSETPVTADISPVVIGPMEVNDTVPFVAVMLAV